jgi:hypothetical protein
MMSQSDLFGADNQEALEGRACVKCGVKQPDENFYMANGGNYRRTECISCMRKYTRVVDKLRKENEYPTEDYQCPICTRNSTEIDTVRKGKVFFLDHCHDSHQFRGWLCDSCNRGLGAFGDDVKRLKRAIDYLSDTT